MRMCNQRAEPTRAPIVDDASVREKAGFKIFATRPLRSLVVAGFAFAALLLIWLYAVPIAVVAEEATSAALDVELFGPGRLDATARSQLSPKATGRIVELRAQAGDRVQAGAALVRLQSDAAEALVRQARSEIGKAHAQLASAQSEFVRVEARLALAARDHARLERLSQVNLDAVAASDLDASASNLATARADRSAALAAVGAAQAALSAAQATLTYHETELADATLRAPYSGLVAQRIHSVGDVVTPGAGVIELVDEATIFVETRFDESVLASVSPGAPARVVFRGTGATEVAGRVNRIDRVVDAETREFTAQIALDSLPERWALGQRVDVHVAASMPAGATISNRTVQWDDDGASVWVARNGRAERRRVTIGLTANERVGIASGLTAGERVIRANSWLYGGRPVRARVEQG